MRAIPYAQDLNRTGGHLYNTAASKECEDCRLLKLEVQAWLVHLQGAMQSTFCPGAGGPPAGIGP